MEDLKWDPGMINEFERRTQRLLPRKSKDFIKKVWKRFPDAKIYGFQWLDRWNFDDLHKAYRTLCGHLASDCQTLDEFFCPKLTSALKSFLGKDETDRIREECALAMEFPYSHEMYRPSYRSHRAGDYADVFFRAIMNAIDFACYKLSLEQSLAVRDDFHCGLDNRIALALRQGDKTMMALIEEAILGDNSEVKLSNLILSGIVKSGNPWALELLGKLLLAAKGQEGLRQSILETCDSGTLDSHIYFIRLILENGLCRFSSVIRAFDTWAGLGFGNQKQKVVEKCMALALKYLSNENAVSDFLPHGIARYPKGDSEGLDSNDTTEIYLALWALGCRDVNNATENACKLLAKGIAYSSSHRFLAELPK